MTKPIFKQMSKKDLLAYVKANRTDDEAIIGLFVNRRNPNATRYPAPLDPEIVRITEDAIAAKIKEQRHRGCPHPQRSGVGRDSEAMTILSLLMLKRHVCGGSFPRKAAAAV